MMIWWLTDWHDNWLHSLIEIVLIDLTLMIERTDPHKAIYTGRFTLQFSQIDSRDPHRPIHTCSERDVPAPTDDPHNLHIFNISPNPTLLTTGVATGTWGWMLNISMQKMSFDPVCSSVEYCCWHAFNEEDCELIVLSWLIFHGNRRKTLFATFWEVDVWKGCHLMRRCHPQLRMSGIFNGFIKFNS